MTATTYKVQEGDSGRLVNRSKSKALSSVLYLPHGGGPLPILGDTSHQGLSQFLAEIKNRLRAPSAILVISAHWEEMQPTITSGHRPEIIHDYYGFPAEAYQIQYPVRGAPQLAQKLFELLKQGGFDPKLDAKRGFDHGLFVPLTLMYPQADIPSLQLSLTTDLNPKKQIALGKSIAALRKENVLIIGSGMSFHNMRVFFSPEIEGDNQCAEFDRWLIDTCTSQIITSAERERRLIEWEKAPSARFCHPREEHLLPLHVCYGIASAETPIAEVVFNKEVMGKLVTGLIW